jgi:hypothetical protein
MPDTHNEPVSLTPTPEDATQSQRDERTPLIPKPGNHDAQNNVEDVPLPKGQLFLVCFARLVEPVAFFSIFPFVNREIVI